MELTGTLPRYNTMHETSGVLYIPTTKHQSLYSYQVPYLDMLGTYPIADIYMKLSGIEMYIHVPAPCNGGHDLHFCTLPYPILKCNGLSVRCMQSVNERQTYLAKGLKHHAINPCSVW